MPKPYSSDFRQKVIEGIEINGLTKSEASQYFNISRNIINLWFQRQKQTEDFQPLKENKSGSKLITSA
jgi:transposase